MSETVYLAGKITGDNHYQSKFYRAGRELSAAGFTVLLPSLLPAGGFSYDAYLRMSSSLMVECDAVCFLPDWEESCGASYEHERALRNGQRVFYYDEWLANKKGQAR